MYIVKLLYKKIQKNILILGRVFGKDVYFLIPDINEEVIKQYLAYPRIRLILNSYSLKIAIDIVSWEILKTSIVENVYEIKEDVELARKVLDFIESRIDRIFRMGGIKINNL